MRPNTEYEKLLRNAGISAEAMAHHQAQLFGGSVEQWRRVIATGDASCFSKTDVERIKAVIRKNPQLAQQYLQMVQAQ